MSILAGYPELIACIMGWLVSSLLKIPTYYSIHRRINLKQAFGTGGMPSSHAATVTATTLAIGLFSGFDHPAFALAVAVSMIVIYDAAGVRREAGYHAVIINRLIDEYVKGPLIDQKKLKEMIGHTPLEVVGGVISGTLTTLILWLIWPK
ncbi:MAG TPA: divergent PAP2 family protein [Anaerolineaceae bacterium]|nr:divergent PAP2 family protein [Chloroflexota bacterium]HNS07702.1 divergent PAP2 family protein [Anaerolineaceae bacterium]HNW14597.1 divergent PAP2 family protein [Anaerolineaceae bacterium]HOE02523.1 divergent PAP2 family protein [Anaerolineaceae bacterium]HOQ69149.1 divergent PAP2 family protein [Anaerolineaceae bacterium]